ncbi:MAG: hypothetical protein WA908_05360 [Pontixanthobacter sp.]
MTRRTRNTPGMVMLGMATIACIGLTACGNGDDTGDSDVALADDAAMAEKTPQTAALNIADGPGVCLDAAAEKLGPDAKIAEVMTNFSVGSDIESRDDKPAGTVTYCMVQYQDPADPRKLLQSSMAGDTGTFGEPAPVEITVTGDASTFNIEDMLIRLGDVDYAALDRTLASLEPKLADAYQPHAWEFVKFTGPDAFQAGHHFRIGAKGRLKTNDIQDTGQVVIAPDGTTVLDDRLVS